MLSWGNLSKQNNFALTCWLFLGVCKCSKRDLIQTTEADNSLKFSLSQICFNFHVRTFQNKNNGSDSFSTVLTFLNSFLDGTESCCVLFSVEDGMGPYFHFPEKCLLLFSFEIVCPLLWCCTPAGLALSSRPPLKVVGREAHAGTMKTFTIVVWVPQLGWWDEKIGSCDIQWLTFHTDEGLGSSCAICKICTYLHFYISSSICILK